MQEVAWVRRQSRGSWSRWERRYCAGLIVMGNVNVRSLPRINVGHLEVGVGEKFHSPKGANSSA